MAEHFLHDSLLLLADIALIEPRVECVELLEMCQDCLLAFKVFLSRATQCGENDVKDEL